MSPLRSISPCPPKDLSTGLTSDQLTFFKEHGFLVIPSALDSNQVSSLLSETANLLDSFDLSTHPMTRFSTGDVNPHVSDDYFLTSGDKLRFFFEEDAFSPSTGELTRPKHRAINKIGHYLHELNPAFKSISINRINAAIATSLGFRDARVLQSMVICKQPEIGGRVPPHQDSTFLYTDPPSAVGFWYALEDCTVENGCLSFASGSHRRAPIRSRFVRIVNKKRIGNEEVETTEGNGTINDKEVSKENKNGDVEDGEEEQDEITTAFVENTGAQYPEYLTEDMEVRKELYELMEVKAGTLVIIHGNVLHKSEKNTSQKGRMIYTFHVIEGQNDYDDKNWLQPPEGGFTRLNTGRHQSVDREGNLRPLREELLQ